MLFCFCSLLCTFFGHPVFDIVIQIFFIWIIHVVLNTMKQTACCLAVATSVTALSTELYNKFSLTRHISPVALVFCIQVKKIQPRSL